MTSRFFAAAAVSSLLLCATAGAAQPPTQGNEPNEGFISSENECRASSMDPGGPAVDGYTRLEFATVRTVPIGRDYWGELRTPVSRFFASRSITRALTLNATYSSRKVDATAPVVSFTQNSGKDGYDWSSRVSNQWLVTPYFLIDDSDVFTTWNLKLDKTYQVAASQAVIDILSRATKLISPTSALLTSLNADRFKDTSQFIDQSISNFLKESVAETAPDKFPLESCVGKDLVQVTLVLPTGADVVRHTAAMQTIGTWTVRLAPAIRSVFLPSYRSDKPTDVIGAIGAGSVFRYLVADNVSLGQYVRSEPAISAAKDEFKTAGADQAATADKLCSLLVDRLATLGFDHFDTAVAIRAYAQLMLSDAQRTEILRDSNCPTLT